MDQVLFTVQKHDAIRAGTHYDVRLVVGNKAYSWATKKELPEVGGQILLFEQPVHTREYALSKKVIIPEGQYGAGETTLVQCKKATIHPDSTEDKLKFNTSSGEKYLLKKLGGKYGETSWLFKNVSDKNKYLEKAALLLTQYQLPDGTTKWVKDSDEVPAGAVLTGGKTYMKRQNKYLTKSASLLAAGLVTHLMQNLTTRFALRNHSVAQHLADQFAAGYHGVVPSGLKNHITQAAIGATMPDVAIMGKSFNKLGQTLGPHIKTLNSRQQLGLRMVTEGRFGDLVKHGLHRDEGVAKAVDLIKAQPGLSEHFPDIRNLTEHIVKPLEEVWRSKNYPLLSNIVSTISHGHVPEVAKAGKPSIFPAVMGAAGSALAEPVLGAFNLTKTVAASDAVRRNPYLKKVTDLVEKHLIKIPLVEGVKRKGQELIRGFKNRAFELGVNPTSAQLRATSGALFSAGEEAGL